MSKAKVFLKHNGVTIYHAYKRGKQNHRMMFWYSTSPELSKDRDLNAKSFDVRELPQITGLDVEVSPETSHVEIICYAIDHGLIKE